MFTSVPVLTSEQVAHVVLADVTSRLPSGSLSLAATSMLTAVSSGVLAISLLATGGSLTGSTLMLTVAVAHKGPVSHISYTKLSEPVKPGSGV